MRFKWTGKKFEYFRVDADWWGTIAPPDPSRFASKWQGEGQVYLDIGAPGRCIRNIYVENLMTCDGTPYTLGSSGELQPSGNYATYEAGDIRWQASGLYQASGTYVPHPAGAITVGHVLKWNGTAWAPAVDEAGGGSAHTITSATHTDATGTPSTSGQLLSWDGSIWRPADRYFQPSGYQVPSGDYATVAQGNQMWSASGVYISDPGGALSGMILGYDGTSWVLSDDQAGGGTTHGLLGETHTDATGSATSGHILGFDGTNWRPTTSGAGGGVGNHSVTGSEHTDSTGTPNTSGQLLSYDGSTWRPADRYFQPSGYQVPSGVYKVASEFYQPSGYQVPSGDYSTVAQGNGLWQASGLYQPSGTYQQAGDYVQLGDNASLDYNQNNVVISGGYFWAKGNGGAAFSGLRLGTFDDAGSYPAYTFITDDLTGDKLTIHSHRWAANNWWTRSSPFGTQKIAALQGLTWSSLDLYGTYPNNDTVGTRISCGGDSFFNSGNVGIGTVSPSEKLGIKGNIKLEQIGNKYLAYNNDSVELKFNNYFISTANQFGQGQLYNELWFGAVNANPFRRIGFYLELPNAGSSDAAGPSNIQATNDKMAIHTSGVDIADNIYVQGDYYENGQIFPEIYALSGNYSVSGNYVTVEQANTDYVLSGSFADQGLHFVDGNLGIFDASPNFKVDINGDLNIGGGGQLYQNAQPFPEIYAYSGMELNALGNVNAIPITSGHGIAWNGTSWVRGDTIFASVLNGTVLKENGNPISNLYEALGAVSTHNSDADAHTVLVRTDGSRPFTAPQAGVAAVGGSDLVTLNQVNSSVGSGYWVAVTSGYEATTTSYWYPTAGGAETVDFTDGTNLSNAWDTIGDGSPNDATNAICDSKFLTGPGSTQQEAVFDNFSVRTAGIAPQLEVVYDVDFYSGDGSWTVEYFISGAYQVIDNGSSTKLKTIWTGTMPDGFSMGNLKVKCQADHGTSTDGFGVTLNIYSVSVYDPETTVTNPGVTTIHNSGLLDVPIRIGTSGTFDTNYMLGVSGNVYVSGNLDGKTLAYAGQNTDERYALSGIAASTTLAALTDTDVGAVASGHLLGWNNTSWVPTTPGAGGGGGATTLAALTDTDIGTLASGQFLMWNDTDWVNAERYLQPSGYQVPSGVYRTASEFYQPSGYQVPSGNYSTVEQNASLYKPLTDFFQPSGYQVPSGDYSTVAQADNTYLKLDTSNDPLTGTLLLSGTSSGERLLFDGAGNNRMRFGNRSTGLPTFSTTSDGTRIVLWQSLGASNSNYAVGIAGNVLWNSVPNADGTQSFRWYGGETLAGKLTSDGVFTANTISGTKLAYGGQNTDERYALSGNTDLGDSRYLKLDASNDPVTGELFVSGNPIAIRGNSGAFFTALELGNLVSAPSTPAFKVNVNDNVGEIFEIQSQQQGLDFWIRRDSGNKEAMRLLSDDADPTRLFLYDADGSATPIRFDCGGDSYFNGGSLGIGTATPATDLEVVGTTTLTPADNTDALVITEPIAGTYNAVFQPRYQSMRLSIGDMNPDNQIVGINTIGNQPGIFISGAHPDHVNLKLSHKSGGIHIQAADTETLRIQTSGAQTQLRRQQNGTGVIINTSFQNFRSVGAANDGVSVVLSDTDDGGAISNAAAWQSLWTSPIAGEEYASTIFKTAVNGSLIEYLRLVGSSKRVGIFDSTPSYALDVGTDNGADGKINAAVSLNYQDEDTDVRYALSGNAANTYLKLDASNGPVTGYLYLSGTNNHFAVQTTSQNQYGPAFRTYRDNDAKPTFAIERTGRHFWGPGGSASPSFDVGIYRNQANTLHVSGSMEFRERTDSPTRNILFMGLQAGSRSAIWNDSANFIINPKWNGTGYLGISGTVISNETVSGLVIQGVAISGKSLSYDGEDTDDRYVLSGSFADQGLHFVDGKLGIFDASPSFPVDINGNLNVQGDIYDNSQLLQELYQASGLYQPSGNYSLSGNYVTVEDANVNYVLSGSFADQGLYFVDSKLGIFDASPSYPVDINGDLNVQGDIYDNSQLLQELYQASGLYQPSGSYALSGNYSLSGNYVTVEEANVNYVLSGSFADQGLHFVDSKLGIFDATPSFPVDINGDLNVQGEIYDNSQLLQEIYQASGLYQPSGNYQLSGNYQVSGDYVTVTNANTDYVLSGSFADQGLYFVDGKLGIFDATPSYPVDINGDLNVQGDIYDNATLLQELYAASGMELNALGNVNAIPTTSGHGIAWNGTSWVRGDTIFADVLNGTTLKQNGNAIDTLFEASGTVDSHNTDVAAHTALVRTDGTRAFVAPQQGVAAVGGNDLVTLNDLTSYIVGSGYWVATTSGYQQTTTSYWYPTAHAAETVGYDDFSVNPTFAYDQNGDGSPNTTTYAQGIALSTSVPFAADDEEELMADTWPSRTAGIAPILQVIYDYTVTNGTGSLTVAYFISGSYQNIINETSPIGKTTWTGGLPDNFNMGNLKVRCRVDHNNDGGDPGDSVQAKIYDISVLDPETTVSNPGVTTIHNSGITNPVRIGTSGTYSNDPILGISGNVYISGKLDVSNGALGDYTDASHVELTVGDATTYGLAQMGKSIFGRTSRVTGNLDLDGTVILANQGNPSTSNILFAMMDGTNSIRFALPQSATGNATYNPRSMLLAGPAPVDDACVTVGYWQTNDSIFHNLACDTGGGGADLGVQNNLEVEGNIYCDQIIESTVAGSLNLSGTTLTWNGSAIPVDEALQVKAISIESPTNAEDIGLFYAPENLTVSGVVAVVRGTTPSVTIQLKHAADRSAAGTAVTSSTAITNTTVGQNLTLSDATIPGGSWVWLESTAQTGTVDELTLSLHYQEDN